MPPLFLHPPHTASSGVKTLVTRYFSGVFHTHPKKPAFFRPFLRFFLAFSFFLGYSPLRPGFLRRKTSWGSQLAACFDSNRSGKKNQEDKHTRWQPSH